VDLTPPPGEGGSLDRKQGPGPVQLVFHWHRLGPQPAIKKNLSETGSWGTSNSESLGYLPLPSPVSLARAGVTQTGRGANFKEGQVLANRRRGQQLGEGPTTWGVLVKVTATGVSVMEFSLDDTVVVSPPTFST